MRLILIDLLKAALRTAFFSAVALVAWASYVTYDNIAVIRERLDRGVTVHVK